MYYHLYVMLWEAPRGNDLIVNKVMSEAQVLRWLFEADVEQVGYGACGGYCYEDSDAEYPAFEALLGEGDKEAAYTLWQRSFDPGSRFIARWLDRPWCDFHGNQSYCGYIKVFDLGRLLGEV